MDLNPVLTEIQGLSPAAKGALQMAGHTLAAPSPAATAAASAPSVIPPGMLLPHPSAGPEPGSISMGDSSPLLSMPSPAPQLVTGPKRGQEMMSNGQATPMGTTMGDTAERSRLLGEKPGVENIAHNIEGSRLGEAHPFLGKLLGGVAQGAGLLGDTLLHAASPGLERLVPGTEGNYARNLSRADTALTQDIGNAQKEAQAAEENATAGKTSAETPEVAPNAESTRNLQGAEAGHAEAETNALQHPAQTWEVHDTDAGPVLFNKATGTAQHLSVDGQPVGPKLKLTQSQPIDGPDGKPHTYMLDDKGNKVVDLGVHYERPQVTNVNAGLTALDRESKQFGTPHQKAVTDANTQLEKIADARAMVNGNAESQALGIPKVLTALVSGAGSGVRITQPELNAIAKARGLTGDVEGTLNSWAGKGRLTAEQQRQLTGILDDVKTRILQKQQIASEALDKINGAQSREDIVQADKEAREKLNSMEKGETAHKVGDTVTLDGQKVTIKKIYPDGTFDY